MPGEGTSLSSAAIRRLSKAGMIDFGAERDLVGRCMSHIWLEEPSTAQVIGLLSDGDQQKIVRARWLAAHPAVLIAEERTRGVDVGTQAEIYALTRELGDGWPRHPGNLQRSTGRTGHLRPRPRDARGPHDRGALPRRGDRGADHGARCIGTGRDGVIQNAHAFARVFDDMSWSRYAGGGTRS